MSGHSNTIVLSSSDEESPPRKKAKPVLNMSEITLTPIKKDKKSGYICISSDEDEDITRNIEKDAEFEQADNFCNNGFKRINMNDDPGTDSIKINDSDDDTCSIVSSNNSSPDKDFKIENSQIQKDVPSLQTEKQSIHTIEIDNNDSNDADSCIILDDELEKSAEQNNKSSEIGEKMEKESSTECSKNLSTSVEQNLSNLTENQSPKRIKRIKLVTPTNNDKSNSNDKPVSDTNEGDTNNSIAENNLPSSIEEENLLIESTSKAHSPIEEENLLIALTSTKEDSPIEEENLLIESTRTKDEAPSVSNISSEGTTDVSNNLINTFLDICQRTLVNTEYDISKKFEVLRKYYKKCERKLADCPSFNKMVENNIEKAKLSPAQAVIGFGEIFHHLKDLALVDAVEVSKKTKMALKKLEHTIRLLVAKIKDLENAELDFDDEENSSYLQLDRFINRLNKVYQKYCELLKSNPYAGRITYSKLNFVDSKYNEINRAISKKYKNNKVFPSYFEMENFIRNVVKNTDITLTDLQIKTESEHCFRKLGEVLQMRRKRELYDTHCMYIENTGDDPAKKDPSLQNVLKSNFVKAQTEIERLCQEYVTKQDHGEEPEVSDNATESSDNESEDVP